MFTSPPPSACMWEDLAEPPPPPPSWFTSVYFHGLTVVAICCGEEAWVWTKLMLKKKKQWLKLFHDPTRVWGRRKPDSFALQSLGHSLWSSYLKMFSLCLFRDFRSVVLLFSFMASHACSPLNSFFTGAGGGNFNTWAGQTCDKYHKIMSTSSLPVGWIPMSGS